MYLMDISLASSIFHSETKESHMLVACAGLVRADDHMRAHLLQNFSYHIPLQYVWLCVWAFVGVGLSVCLSV